MARVDISGVYVTKNEYLEVAAGKKGRYIFIFDGRELTIFETQDGVPFSKKVFSGSFKDLIAKLTEETEVTGSVDLEENSGTATAFS